MAFCPECGKAVTPDEAACSSCGKQLRSDGKKARAGRFHGTMMMTAPEVKKEPPANINTQRPTEQAQVVAAAAGMTSPRLGMPAAAKHNSAPPSAKQAAFTPNTAAATLGRPAQLQMKATMIGAGVASNTAAQKPEQKHATMLGAALPPTTPRSKPPGAAPAASQAKSAIAAQAKASSSPPAQAQEIAKSERPPVVRQTIPQASTSPSVRAVQSMPVSPAVEGDEPRRALPVPAAPAAAPILHDAQTVPSPVPPRAEPQSPNPARMVQAIPEVEATVVDPSELPNNLRTAPRLYLPGDPMAPQPPAATRAPRLRERPFAPETPDVEGHGKYIMLYWALCVAIVAAACALAFRLF